MLICLSWNKRHPTCSKEFSLPSNIYHFRHTTFQQIVLDYLALFNLPSRMPISTFSGLLLIRRVQVLLLEFFNSLMLHASSVLVPNCVIVKLEAYFTLNSTEIPNCLIAILEACLAFYKKLTTLNSKKLSLHFYRV